MPWPHQIERWRQFVLWECKDVYPDLVLAIIKKESGGIPGLVAGASCKPWPIPLAGGGTITYNHALGLMQIVPRTIASYNERHPDEIVYYEDMKGQDERAARLQIRVGCAVYASAVNALFRYDPRIFPAPSPGNATVEQLKLALVAYRMGFGALRKKLDKLRELGKPLTFESLANTFPNWGMNEQGQWINRPIFYTSTLWDAAINHGMQPGEPTPPWTPGPTTPPGSPPPAIAGISNQTLGLLITVLVVSYKVWKSMKK